MQIKEKKKIPDEAFITFKNYRWIKPEYAQLYSERMGSTHVMNQSRYTCIVGYFYSQPYYNGLCTPIYLDEGRFQKNFLRKLSNFKIRSMKVRRNYECILFSKPDK